VVLTQAEANALMGMPKRFASPTPIDFPDPGEKATFDIVSVDERERFLADVNRGRMRLRKCSYQERYRVVEILARLDLGGPPHENPDGKVVPCPHLHLYREGYGDKWAQPLPGGFKSTSNLVTTFRDFMAFCNITGVPDIQAGLLWCSV